MKKSLILLISILTFGSAFADSQKQICFEKICNKNLPLKSNLEVISDLRNEAKAEYDKSKLKKEVEKKLEQSLEAMKRSWARRYQYVKKINDKKLEFQDISKFDFTLFYVANQVMGRLGQYIENDVISLKSGLVRLISYDSEKAATYLKSQGLSENEVNWIISLEKAILGDQKFNRILVVAFSQDELPQYIFNSVLNNDKLSILNATHTEVSEAILKLEYSKSLSQDSRDTFFIERILKKLKAVALLREFPDFVLESINSDLFMSEVILNYFSKGSLYKIGSSIPKIIWKPYLEALNSLDAEIINIDKVISKEKFKEISDSVLKACHSGVVDSLAMTISKKDIDSFRSELSYLKRKGQEFVTRYTTRSLLNYLDDRISELQFNIPATKKFSEKYILKSLDNYISESADDLVEIPFMGIMANKENLFSVDSVTELCSLGEIEYNYLDDKVAPNHDRPLMHLNWMTVKNPERYKMILAHEFGHIIFYAMRNQFKVAPSGNRNISSEGYKKIAKFLNCHGEAHPAEPTTLDARFENGTIELGLKKYTSEDVADLFAAFVYKGSDTYNSFCQLIHFDEKMPILDLINPSEDDVHSASFYRVINTENILGNDLDSSCIKVLNEKPEVKLNMCLNI